MTDDFSNVPTDATPPDPQDPGMKQLLAKPPKLMKLGMGAPVMQMRDAGASVPEIAQKLEVPEKQVGELVKAVESLPAEAQAQADHSLRSSSVFAIFERLEELFDDTMRMSKLAEENPLLYKDYLNTRIQVLKLVKDCQKDEMVTKQRDDEFNAILAEIGKEDLGLQNRIVKRIQQLRAARGLIKGF